jgi:putative transposase
MCRLLTVSKSGFYAWQGRPMSPHERRDVELSALVHEIHERSHRTYGAPRIHVELRESYGVRIGRKRVARLMRRAGLQGVQKRRFWCTTRSGAAERWAPDLVERQFLADRPDALWVADVTYVPTAEGFLYLAVVLDVFSRLVVGWAMAARLASQLVLDALGMAYAQRAPRDVIHHSDHGSGVHRDCFRHAVHEARRTSIDGQCGRLLRQCHGRKLLCDAGVRGVGSKSLSDSGGGAHSNLLLDPLVV